LHFTGQTQDLKPSRQGYSTARWEPGGQVDPSAIPLGVGPRIPPRSRSLAVVTTNLRPGYSRKNGIPYSAKTTLREYYDLFTEPNGDTWFMVMTLTGTTAPTQNTTLQIVNPDTFYLDRDNQIDFRVGKV